MIKPRSILQLTVTGFLAVTGLLIAALLITMQQLDGLSDRSQRAVNQTIIAMDASRTLLQQSTAMERNARQFSIVKDDDILQVYQERHETFVMAADRLLAARLNESLDEQVSQIQLLELAVSGEIRDLSTRALESRFQELLQSANGIADTVNQWASQQVQTIQQESTETRRLLTMQAVALVATALMLAAVFTALITRPLLRVERVIERLGQGGYTDAIEITGPRDLVKLGQRLEWLRDRLAKLEQQRSSFLRHVSHELKTPLAAIQESTSLFKDGIVGELSDEQKKLIQIQSNSAQRLHHIIDDLLRHHSDSFAVISAQPVAIALDELIRQGIAAHGPNLLAKSIYIDSQLEKLSIFGNPEQIRVIVDNLLSNAIRFSPDGGNIRISLHGEADEVITRIADQGPGIDEDDLERIFEAFYQGSQPSDSNYKGSGLGLAITQEYVAANSGRITVIPGGSGALFELRFPRSGKSQPGTGTASTTKTGGFAPG